MWFVALQPEGTGFETCLGAFGFDYCSVTISAAVWISFLASFISLGKATLVTFAKEEQWTDKFQNIIILAYFLLLKVMSWKIKCPNSTVGTFSNGFIKLVQKTDITHSKCLFFLFMLVFQTNPYTLSSSDERKRKKAKLSTKNHSLFFFCSYSYTTSCDL